VLVELDKVAQQLEAHHQYLLQVVRKLGTVSENMQQLDWRGAQFLRVPAVYQKPGLVHIHISDP
jgi:hypothetical protein